MSLLVSTPLVSAAAVFVVVLLVLLFVGRPARSTQPGTRLTEYMNVPASAGTVQPLATRQRPPGSAWERLLASAAITAPERLRTQAAADLSRAGVAMNPNVFLGIRGLLLIGVPLLTGFWLLSSPQRGPVQWGILGFAVVLAPRLPKMWLRRRIKANQRAIDRALPYALDLMVACLEGGLSLEATLDKVAEQSESLLSDEIRRTLREMTLGRPGAEALRDLGVRTGAADLKRLTENVIQAERMGISIAHTMRTLAEDSRIRRRQRAEEAARKAPVKMMPVLIFFIMPAMMAIVMTPAAIALIHVFGHL
jgi:tight adherence protein C